MYVPEATKGNLGHLKVALQDRPSVKEDPLATSKQFNQQNQGLEEMAKNFASFVHRHLPCKIPEFGSTTPAFFIWAIPRDWLPTAAMKPT